MTPLPTINGRECIRALERGGFEVVRQTGSHVIMRRNNPKVRVIVPNHRKDLRPGTLRSIIRNSGLTVEEFVKLLRS